jgi:hypothetical protein
MNKIKELTQAIRNYSECELDYGTLKTLKMIDDEAGRLETKLQNTSSNSDYAKCKIEAEIKRLEDNPEGDYTTRISALEWALHIIAER